MNSLEALLFAQMQSARLTPVHEYRFHPVRKWRFDFAFVGERIAVEVEGATWAGGRHTRGSGFEADCEKYNTAACLGWRVVRVTSVMVRDGRAINFIKLIMGG